MINNNKKINFFKIHGTGNDFIVINDIYNNIFNEQDQYFFKKLCNRHIGIGGDGVILIQKDYECDFYMKYYNSNGKIGSMCGNGGRCAIYLSRILGLLSNKNKSETLFKTIDGYHKGFIKSNNIISIELASIKKNKIEINPNYTFIDTGSPHHVIFCEKIIDINVCKIGKKIRYNNKYLKKGVNVNFVQINNLKNNNINIQVRTYERGVENETLSCGTGVVASVIASVENRKIKKNNNKIEVDTLGGKLWVSFDIKNEEYQKIYLTGPVKLVFEGWFFIKKN
ncbi:diaminopimelate epimerase [Blattabacterium cuenoti]|uniref:diaminopimelate epimerase n=1 Tax=Blattabacterium cuenoti TaxID=1653831 RepID=UPI00163D29FC|nr:diaminopimelate epimerase [Blattabacterium cuenoti]